MMTYATYCYRRRAARERREAALYWALGLGTAAWLLVGTLLPTGPVM